jgi:hypothetical protein
MGVYTYLIRLKTTLKLSIRRYKSLRIAKCQREIYQTLRNLIRFRKKTDMRNKLLKIALVTTWER